MLFLSSYCSGRVETHPGRCRFPTRAWDRRQTLQHVSSWFIFLAVVTCRCLIFSCSVITCRLLRFSCSDASQIFGTFLKQLLNETLALAAIMVAARSRCMVQEAFFDVFPSKVKGSPPIRTMASILPLNVKHPPYGRNRNNLFLSFQFLS